MQPDALQTIICTLAARAQNTRRMSQSTQTHHQQLHNGRELAGGIVASDYALAQMKCNQYLEHICRQHAFNRSEVHQAAGHVEHWCNDSHGDCRLSASLW